MANRAGTFKKGNKASVGNPGPRGNPITQVLISQLHEVDKNTNREKIHELVEELLKLACGYMSEIAVTKKTKEGPVTVMKTVEVPGDIAAIKEVFDRVEGKAPQSVTVGGDPKNPLITAEQNAAIATVTAFVNEAAREKSSGNARPHRLDS